MLLGDRFGHTYGQSQWLKYPFQAHSTPMLRLAEVKGDVKTG